ncbi:beta-ketoacyl synthase N-terminal-like domain-containing protein [Dinoroseobacter sp. S375]|uniref:beta-ketoacyl synthase N-terminal-like domain-containing protein n=1 Tax=Dinoroseobacter sp. S375 TaxID=3415136 RepID=UPI003C7EBC02
MTSRGGPSRLPENEPIAIVGMASIYPEAPDTSTFWRNITDKVDAVADAPDDWCGDLFLDPDSKANDRIYTNRGGFLRDLAVFDPLRHGVMPTSIDGGEPDQFLALQVAAEAVQDAGFDTRPVPGDRVAVILGRGTYINRGFTSVVQHGIMVDRFLSILKKLHPDTSEDELADVKAQLKASLPPFNAEMAPALVPNLVTGRISNRLDFKGANYIVDAACASSLIAMDRGVADLRAGRCDMAVVGGVHASTPAPIYQIFCQLEALSRKGAIRPFSANADGTLLAEGVGLMCIKRLSDAEAAGDRIYALVRGVGVASDGKGLGILAPRIEGETLALERAYEDAGIAPETVGLIEAHGTATALGDATEVEALTGLMGPRQGEAPSCALGSVKSMIGHCLPASGSAGLIKSAMALYHKTLPPTLLDEANPKLGIEGSPFYLNTETRPWIHGADTPRRAGVNAFGFGGINAHVVLEEYTGAPQPQPNLTRSSELLVASAPDAQSLSARLNEIHAAIGAQPDLAEVARTANAVPDTGPWRAAIVARDATDAMAKIDKILSRIAKGKDRLKDRKGAYLNAKPLAAEGKVAFMFPGEGSQHIGMLRELMLHRPEMRHWFDLVDGAFAGHSRNLLPSQVIFPPPETAEEGGALWRMDIGPEAIFAANQAVAALYDGIGLSADMLVGHSTGEYSALYAGGVTRRSDMAQLQQEMRALNDHYETLSSEGLIAEGALVALGAVDGAALEDKLAGRDDVYLAMDNCPNQKVVAAFTEAGRDYALSLAPALGGFEELLPFARAYHSPAFAPFSARLLSFLEGMEIAPPERPVYSCLSTGIFPDDPQAIRALTAEQWSGRVRFVETVRKMYADGARIFVECGPRNNLSAFVNDILRGQDHLAVAVDTPSVKGLDQLHHLAAQLAVEAVPMDLGALAAPMAGAVAYDGPSRPQVLKMGVQPMDVAAPPKRAAQTPKDTSQGAAPTLEPGPVATGSEEKTNPGQPSGVANSPQAPALLQGRVSETTPRGASPVAASAPTIQPATQAPTEAAAVVDAYFNTLETFLSSETDIMSAYLGGGIPAPITDPATAVPVSAEAAPQRFPMLASVTPALDGRSLTARIEIDPASAPYLNDHSFGRGLSQRDAGLTGLPVVPLTFSMEALAEAAAALRPSLTVVGMTEVRASRWFALDTPPLVVEAQAELREEGAETLVRVRIRAADGPALRPILIEADVRLAPSYAPSPAAEALSYGAPRDVIWSQSDVYERIMFHGPRLWAVETMDVVGSEGVEGTLVGLPHDDLYAGIPNPGFETDAITLDAVGQLVGVWSAEMLPEAFHIFPFRVERLDVFRPRLAPGERARCRAQIALVGGDEMRAYIDVVTADNRLQCRIEGWWDKRFELPERFFQARLAPAQNPLSRPMALPGGAALPEGVALMACDDISDDLLDGSGGIWAKVLAGLILSAPERAEFAAMAKATDKRRWEWLRGRAAAKDAARACLGLAIAPADLPLVVPGEDDGPVIDPTFPEAWGRAPLISIAHKGAQAIAVAADPARYAGVGVDLERVAPRTPAFLDTAFTAPERAMIAAQTDPAAQARMSTRLWCAKEAVGKSFGVGLAQALDRFEVQSDAQGDRPAVVRDRSLNLNIAVTGLAEIAPDLIAAVVLRPHD